MQIASVAANDHTDFLDLVNAEIRPDRAKTNAWDDFPLVLDVENRDWQLAAYSEEGRLAAGIACLIREYQTSCGGLAIAGIGSVVTRPEFRGQGLSAALQNEMLKRLKGNNVPLAVLWTDQPAIYAGRGFAAAGWEIHMDLTDATLPDLPDESLRFRLYEDRDAATVERLYQDHFLHTCRSSGDSSRLYGMPGTTGVLVVDGTGTARAAAFCGKGADFPDYVAEWSGPTELVIPLLGQVKAQGLANKVLVPAGSEKIVNPLVERKAGWFAIPAGYWAILDSDQLEAAVAHHGGVQPTARESAIDWLGTVDAAGQPVAGAMDVAIWGLDSV